MLGFVDGNMFLLGGLLSDGKEVRHLKDLLLESKGSKLVSLNLLLTVVDFIGVSTAN